MVVESSIVCTPCVLKLAPPDFTVFSDLEDSEVVLATPEISPPDHTIFSDFKDNQVVPVTPKPCELVNVPDVLDFEGKEAEGTKENPVPTEIYYSVPVLKAKGILPLFTILVSTSSFFSLDNLN